MKVVNIGIGKMGSACVRAMLRAGHELRLYGLFESEFEPFKDTPAEWVTDLVDAAKWCDIFQFQINSYDGIKKMLEDEELQAALNGKIVSNLATGTPKVASEMEKFVRGFGGRYVDGAIEAYPEAIGTEDGMIVFAGDEEAYHEAESVYNSLGPTRNRFISTDVTLANCVDMMLLPMQYCDLGIILLVGSTARKAGISLTEARELFGEGGFTSTVTMNDVLDRAYDKIVSGDYSTQSASISVQLHGLETVLETMDYYGVDRSSLGSLVDVMERAIEAGHGDEDTAAAVEVM